MLLLLLALGLGACGPIKNLDPLGGLGGADNSRYGFETGVGAWTPAPVGDGGSCTGVSHAPGRSFFGQASLAMEMLNMGGHYPSNSSCPGVDNAARVTLDLSVSPQDLTGKTVSAWIYLPAAARYSAEAPTQGQIYLIDNSGDTYADAPGVNLEADSWKRISFSPVAGGAFDPSAIKRVGVKVSAAGAAPCSFLYSGIVLVDSVDW